MDDFFGLATVEDQCKSRFMLKLSLLKNHFATFVTCINVGGMECRV